MAAFMFMAAMPLGVAQGGIVSTEEVIRADRTLQQEDAVADRARIDAFLQREDVRIQLETLGVAPEEVASRLDALSDAEIDRIAGRVDQIPAGQGPVGFLVGAAIVVFVVLVLTDIFGVTDIFTFIKSGN